LAVAHFYKMKMGNAAIDLCVRDDLPQANQRTVHRMAAMAEHEAGAIGARTKAALAAASVEILMARLAVKLFEVGQIQISATRIPSKARGDPL
jgi:hypothetical protein